MGHVFLKICHIFVLRYLPLSLHSLFLTFTKHKRAMLRRAVLQSRSVGRSSSVNQDRFSARFTPVSIIRFASPTPTSTNGADVSEIQDEKELEKLVEESQTKSIVVDFYANWCQPCKILTPRLMKALEGKSRSVKMVKVDVDMFPNIAEALKVSSLPTVMLLHRGQFVEKFSGVITEDDCEKFVNRAVDRVRDESDENSEFRENEKVRSSSDVVDVATIQSKVEVALQGLAEGSSASSATQRDALVAFTNSEESMRSAPAFLRAEIYSVLAMIELSGSEASQSLESVDSLVIAAEQILAEAKKDGIGSPKVSFSAIAARARLKLRIRANENNITFGDHAKCIFEYEESNAKSFDSCLRAVLASVVVSDWERACDFSLRLLSLKSDIHAKENSKTLGREICVEVIDSINFGATSSLAERTRRRLASILFA